MKHQKLLISAAACLILALPVIGYADGARKKGMEAFHPGAAIESYGKIADVVYDQNFSKRTKFKVVFDVSKPGEAGKVNRSFDSIARFINMHYAEGIPVKNMKLALIIHGGATKEMTKDGYYQSAFETGNANAALVQELIDNGVEIYVCGQSAAFHGVNNADLLPGVHMALSAMTAHALLQQKNYTLNPF
jgi:intracellular sulfur oxidation DsrE/DsrF family protein